MQLFFCAIYHFLALIFQAPENIKVVYLFANGMGMKVFTAQQIREIDVYTIKHEPIKSADLMERAAIAILRAFVGKFSASQPVFIFAGPGNNGGDGIALARHLIELGYDVKVYVVKSEKYSQDLEINLERLKKQGIAHVNLISKPKDFPTLPRNTMVIDSLLGSGLSRPLSGLYSTLVDYLNGIDSTNVAIDIPSGLYSEQNSYPNTNPIFRADYTITLQFPKLSFFFPENHRFIGSWEVVDIGLHPQGIESLPTPYFFVQDYLVKKLLPQRSKFDHKGNRGHCLIIAGSYGMYGATVICAKSCLLMGAGLVTIHTSKSGLPILQQSIPEAMVSIDRYNDYFTRIDAVERFDAIAIGPGMGTSKQSVKGLEQLLISAQSPLVVDADGLNLIAENPYLLNLLPEQTIITPHVGEFNRLFGHTPLGYDRLMKSIELAAKHSLIIVLKGAHTQVVCPDGQVYFNSTGNSAMATAGSGDALTGIIASLLGQGLDPKDAAIAGVYIHGLAGDMALKKNDGGTISAGCIAQELPYAIGSLRK